MPSVAGRTRRTLDSFTFLPLGRDWSALDLFSFGESMAEICKQASKVSSAAVVEARGVRLVAAVADEISKKRNSLDPGCDYVENQGEENMNESTPGEGATLMVSEPTEDSDLGSVVEGGCPRYGVASVCGRRRDMEDAVTVRLDFVRLGLRHHFFSVYDGHGCSHVAESCRDRMHEMVAEEISTSMHDMGLDWTAIMGRSFARMDEAAAASCDNAGSASGTVASCRCEMQTTKCDHVGSTAVVAVVEPTRIIVANCGDSRAVLCRDGVAVPLSTDHKPDRPDELRRIEAAGGRVIYWDGARVLGVLAMSRAIGKLIKLHPFFSAHALFAPFGFIHCDYSAGDSYLKPYVIAEPEVTVTERKEQDECLILGSDGLWDVVSNEMACEIARTCLRNNVPSSEEEEEEREWDWACSDAALLLAKLALARRSTDNVTVVVVDLRPRPSNEAF